MKLRWKIASTAGALLVVVGSWLVLFSRHSQSELEKYKAELRAKGEILELDKLVPQGTGQLNDLDDFVKAAQQLKAEEFQAGTILWNFPAQEAATLISTADQIQLMVEKGKSISWENFADALDRHAEELQIIRDFLTNAPNRLNGDYKDLRNLPKSPFVEKRVAGQWLAASALRNTRDQAPKLVVRDVRALCDLSNMHSEDPTLVNAMIRVALAGLINAPVWEALHGITNWTEPDLEALQSAVEQIDLLETLEKGMTGERAFGLNSFEAAIKGSSISPATPNTSQLLAEALWRNTVAGDDLMFYLRFMQSYVQAIRKARKTQDFSELQSYLQNRSITFQQMAASWQRYRYTYSLIAIPNFTRVSEHSAHNEIQRRLCVVAIALKRYELRHGRLPQDLNALVPEFLSAVPFDCMDGKPLRYKLKADGSFVLYSIGGDEKDDGGDPAPEKKGDALELWKGRDAVWPVPVED